MEYNLRAIGKRLVYFAHRKDMILDSQRVDCGRQSPQMAMIGSLLFT